MIVCCPQIYEDELAYSWFARYHVHSGHLTYRATAEKLFQNRDVIPSPEFYAPLTEDTQAMIERYMPLPQFISQHTMFPFYSRFLPLDRRRRAFDMLLDMDKKFYDLLYIRKRKSDQANRFRYCPMCAAADRQRYGETYWHRSHQLTGVDICLKHRCRLEETEVSSITENTRFSLIHAERAVPYDGKPNMNVTELEFGIAAYILEVFNADMNFENDTAVGKFLRHKLEGTKYLSTRGIQVFTRVLHDDLTKFYGEKLPFTLSEWFHIQKILCSQTFHTYDICYLAYFLNIPVSEILNMSVLELSYQERFDNQLRTLRSQGMTQKQAAEKMGISLQAVKDIEEKRWKQ